MPRNIILISILFLSVNAAYSNHYHAPHPLARTLLEFYSRANNYFCNKPYFYHGSTVAVHTGQLFAFSEMFEFHKNNIIKLADFRGQLNTYQTNALDLASLFAEQNVTPLIPLKHGITWQYRPQKNDFQPAVFILYPYLSPYVNGN